MAITIQTKMAMREYYVRYEVRSIHLKSRITTLLGDIDRWGRPLLSRSTVKVVASSTYTARREVEDWYPRYASQVGDPSLFLHKILYVHKVQRKKGRQTLQRV